MTDTTTTTDTAAPTNGTTADASNRLVIRGLKVAPAANPEREILQGIDLEVEPGSGCSWPSSTRRQSRA